MREFGRSERVADFIRDELASIIQRQMRDPRVGMVSVNEAKVSKDLSWADVYVSSHETRTEAERAELLEVLNKAAGYFRSELAKRHKMRTTPKPRFHYDEVVERGPAMESLIDRAVREDAAQQAGVDREDAPDG
ncbi:MAG: 30S ribosome-binding factor RbfA [Pseudomonadota bacterium]